MDVKLITLNPGHFHAALVQKEMYAHVAGRVHADKPWVITSDDLPKLETALNTADARGLIAYDIMTERYEITSLLQKEMVNDAATFGTMVPGTPDEPGVYMESVHYLMKTVA